MTRTSGHELLAQLLDAATDTTPASPPTAGPAFTVPRQALLPTLERAAAVVPTRDVMDVLRNLHLNTNDSTLRITATDMQLSLVALVPAATITTPGTAVIPARRLLDIIRHASEDTVDLRVTGTTARITIARTVWNLRLPSGADYPTLPRLADSVLTDVDRSTFANALRRVRYAAGKDTSRVNLMLIDARPDRFTASDGSRIQQAPAGHIPFPFLLTLPAADDLLKLLASTDTDTISVGHSTNHLIFNLGDDLFLANKPTIQYPDMDAVLLRPALTNRHQLTTGRAALLAAIKRIRINADPTTAAIALRPTRTTLAVASRDQHGNEATDTIDATWDQPERTVVVNHTHLTDIISGHPDQTLTFWLGEDTRTRKTPLLLRDDTGAVAAVPQMLTDWPTS